MNLHIVFDCQQYEEERKYIYDSIITELEYYIEKYKIPTPMQEILPADAINILLDAATTGRANQAHYQEMLTTLLGANLNIELPNHILNQIKR